MWPKWRGSGRARRRRNCARASSPDSFISNICASYVETKLEPEAEASRAASAKEARQRWREANPWWRMVRGAVGARKGHSGALNRAIAAAPESTKKKLSARRLARSPLNLLLSSGVELTAAVDQSGNNVTVKGLMLPKTLSVSKVTVNGKIVVAKRPGALDPTKVLHGDSITLKGLPHHIASVAEVKSNRLTLMPIKTRKRPRVWRGMAYERPAEERPAARGGRSTARRLQRVVRQRLELRAHHRRLAAPGYVCYYAEHVQPRVAIDRWPRPKRRPMPRRPRRRRRGPSSRAEARRRRAKAAAGQAAAEARAAEEQSQEEEATDELGQVVR